MFTGLTVFALALLVNSLFLIIIIIIINIYFAVLETLVFRDCTNLVEDFSKKNLKIYF